MPSLCPSCKGSSLSFLWLFGILLTSSATDPSHSVRGDSGKSLYSLFGVLEGSRPEVLEEAASRAALEWWKGDAKCSETDRNGLRLALEIQHAASVLLSPLFRPAYDLVDLDPWDGLISASAVAAAAAAVGGAGNAESAGLDSQQAACTAASGTGEEQRDNHAFALNGQQVPPSGASCGVSARESTTGVADCCRETAGGGSEGNATRALECTRAVWAAALGERSEVAGGGDKDVEPTWAAAWPSAAEDINGEGIWEEVFSDNAPWVLLLFSPFGQSARALEATWEALAPRLEGMVKLGRVDALREPQIAARLLSAVRRWASGSGQVQDKSGGPGLLPLILGRPSSCRHTDCLVPSPNLSWLVPLGQQQADIQTLDDADGGCSPTSETDGDNSNSTPRTREALLRQADEEAVRVLEHWALLGMSRVPRMRILRLADVGPKFFRGAPSHKVRAVFLMEAGASIPPPAVQFWAARLSHDMHWAAVLWSPLEAQVWTKWWGVSEPPALGLYREPRQDPIVFHGPFNATVLRVILERYRHFELRQLRRDTLVPLGCDPTQLPPPSPAAVWRWRKKTEGHAGAVAVGSTGKGLDENELHLLPGAFTRYCAVVVSSPSGGLTDARLLLLEIQRALGRATKALREQEEEEELESEQEGGGGGGVTGSDGEAGEDEGELVGTDEGAEKAGILGLSGLGSGPLDPLAASLPLSLVQAWDEGRLSLAWMDGSSQARYCAFVLGFEGAQFCRKKGKEAGVGLYLTLLRPEPKAGEWEDGEEVAGGSSSGGGSREKESSVPKTPSVGFSLLVSLYKDGPLNDSQKIAAWMGNAVAKGDQHMQLPLSSRLPPPMAEEETVSFFERAKESLSGIFSRVEASIASILHPSADSRPDVQGQGVVLLELSSLLKPALTVIAVMYISWRLLAPWQRQ